MGVYDNKLNYGQTNGAAGGVGHPNKIPSNVLKVLNLKIKGDLTGVPSEKADKTKIKNKTGIYCAHAMVDKAIESGDAEALVMALAILNEELEKLNE